jgi:hypothetical protein
MYIIKADPTLSADKVFTLTKRALLLFYSPKNNLSDFKSTYTKVQSNKSGTDLTSGI